MNDICEDKCECPAKGWADLAVAEIRALRQRLAEVETECQRLVIRLNDEETKSLEAERAHDALRTGLSALVTDAHRMEKLQTVVQLQSAIAQLANRAALLAAEEGK